jgi:hypothetical protein
MADLALRRLVGDASAEGILHTYDGRRDLLRAVDVRPRASCNLCGQDPKIHDIQESRYTNPSCAA